MTKEDRTEFINIKELGQQNNKMLNEIKISIGGSKELGIIGLAEQQKKDNEFHVELQGYMLKTANSLKILSTAAEQNIKGHKNIDQRIDPIEIHYNTSKTVRNWLIAALGVIFSLTALYKIFQNII